MFNLDHFRRMYPRLCSGAGSGCQVRSTGPPNSRFGTDHESECPGQEGRETVSVERALLRSFTIHDGVVTTVGRSRVPRLRPVRRRVLQDPDLRLLPVLRSQVLSSGRHRDGVGGSWSSRGARGRSVRCLLHWSEVRERCLRTGPRGVSLFGSSRVETFPTRTLESSQFFVVLLRPFRCPREISDRGGGDEYRRDS